jgi:betaine-homocysteine S-methyltransferase
MVTMSFEQAEPRTYEGDTPADAARTLRDAGADIVGVNCLNGPEQQVPIALAMREAVGDSVHVAAQPVAYRTTTDEPDFTAWASFPYELDPLQLSRHEMAEFAREAAEGGVRYIGSCCGAVQSHVRAMAKVLGKVTSAEREWKNPEGRAMSAYEYYAHTETEV